VNGTDIAVVGGGIAGASVAWHLSERTDRRVVVYERGEVAAETTAKSAAFFGFYGSEVEERMKRYAMAVYNDFLADPRADPRHDLVGRLRVATTEEGARSLGETAPTGTFSLAGEGVHERVLCPELDTGAVAGARYRPAVGYHRPRELAAEFAARARENGVSFETGRTVEDVLVDGHVEALVVDGERIGVEAVVAAGGPWNPQVATMAGVDLPVHHSLAPAMVLERAGKPRKAGTALPIVSHVESGAYARDHGDGRILVAHYPTDRDPDARVDPAAVGDTVPDGAHAEMDAFIENVLPPLSSAREVEEWAGVRSHTPDGHPIAGWTDVPGFSIAAFHSSGIQLAPAVGRVVADQLVNGESTDLHATLSISRFDGHEEAPFAL